MCFHGVLFYINFKELDEDYPMTKCLVKIKDQYGNYAVHPDCETSRFLARIAGTKTLTLNTIKYAKQLGYTFEERPKVNLSATYHDKLGVQL